MSETDFFDAEAITQNALDTYQHLRRGGWLRRVQHSSSPLELWTAFEFDMRDCVTLFQIGIDAPSPVIEATVRAWARKWATSHPNRARRPLWRQIASLDRASLWRIIEVAAYADVPGPDTVPNLHLIENEEEIVDLIDWSDR